MHVGPLISFYRSGYIFKVAIHRSDDAFEEMKVHFCAAVFLNCNLINNTQGFIFLIFGTICKTQG